VADTKPLVEPAFSGIRHLPSELGPGSIVARGRVCSFPFLAHALEKPQF
jgi:hypothetical protein